MAAALIPWALGALFAGLAIAATGEGEKEGEAAPPTPEPPDEPDPLTRAVADADPGELRAEAQKATEAGKTKAAAVLTTMAKEAEAGKLKPVELPRPDPTVPAAPTDAQIAAQAFAAAAVALNAHLRRSKRGEEDRDDVRDFQRGEGGLKVDGLYGPKTAKAMAKYVFPPADPKYWPRDNPDRAKLQYLAWLKAEYEKRGQTFPDLASMAKAKKTTPPVVAPTVPIIVKSPGQPTTFQPAAEPTPIPAGVATAINKAAEAVTTAVKTGDAAPPPIKPIPVSLPTEAVPEPKTEQQKLAEALAAHIETTTRGSENKQLVRRFQEGEGGAAGNIDGLYGPKTAKALGKYVVPPPTPLYWPRSVPLAQSKADWQKYLATLQTATVAGWANVMGDEVVGGRRERRRRRRKRRARRRKRRARRRARFRKAFRKVGRALKKVAQSKVVKGIAGAVAVVYPPAGVPLSAGLAAADKAIAAAERGGKAVRAIKRGIRSPTGRQRADRDARVGRAAADAIRHTARVARRGNAEAQRGLALLAVAKRRRAVLRAYGLGV